MHNSTIARKKDGEELYGVCFTNRSLEIGEKIYIRIAETHARWLGSMEFGLTNTDPVNTTLPSMDNLTGITIKTIENSAAVNDVICMSVNYDATISCCINDILLFTEKLTSVSVNDPVWLVFNLTGNTRAIEISQNKPEETHVRKILLMEIKG